MTPQEFTKIRRRLFGTQVAAAAAIGVTQGTIAHWERGRVGVPQYAVNLIIAYEAPERMTKAVKSALGKGAESE